MLTPLPRKGHVAAGTLLGRAFLNDPMWEAIFSDPDKRPELLISLFTGLTKTAVAAGGLAETTSGIDAVALWLPPEKDTGFWAMVKSGFALPRLVMGLPAARHCNPGWPAFNPELGVWTS